MIKFWINFLAVFVLLIGFASILGETKAFGDFDIGLPVKKCFDDSTCNVDCTMFFGDCSGGCSSSSSCKDCVCDKNADIDPNACFCQKPT